MEIKNNFKGKGKNCTKYKIVKHNIKLLILVKNPSSLPIIFRLWLQSKLLTIINFLGKLFKIIIFNF